MSIDTRHYADNTSTTVQYPWGTMTGARAMCSDGIVRKCHNIKEPDTFFSIPCNVEAHGRVVKGYITFTTAEGFDTPTDDDPTQVQFRQYQYSNDGTLPDWPKAGV